MPLIRKDPPKTSPVPVINPTADMISLREGAVEERWQAARRLARVEEAIPAMAGALESETEARVREAILTGLVTLNNAASVQCIIPLLRSDDSARRTEALDALKAMPTAMASHVILLLADLDPDVRILACELARDVRSEGAAAALAGVLDRDQVLNVCAAAIDALAEIGTATEKPSLKRCAERFAGDPFIAFAVKTALGRIGNALE
jgi:HEAT repeat protein